MTKHIASYLFVLLLLSGCGGVPLFNDTPRKDPAPVKDTTADKAQEEAVQLAPYRAPTQFEQAPSHSSAVQGLMETAQRQREMGQLEEAVATLERGLGIEPRNAHLWNRLAHVRQQQGQSALAVDLAAKSNDLAGGDIELKRDNWNLIGTARQALGDIEGAKSAERKARMLY
jgi:predicted negative regulator of RcsB-dependent stress response